MVETMQNLSMDRRMIEEISGEISKDVSESIFYNLMHAKHLPEIKAIQEGKIKTTPIEKIKARIKESLSE